MRLNDVNTTDLTDAIRLGCRMMCNVFNADDGDIPFFGSEVRPNPQFGFSGAHTESHVPGRHLNALLNAEDAAGIAVPADAIDKHANAAFFSYGGPLALPLNRSRIGGPLELFTTHNVREGFHALYPLVKYRGSERARELAERSIGELLRAVPARHGLGPRPPAALRADGSRGHLHHRHRPRYRPAGQVLPGDRTRPGAGAGRDARRQDHP